MLTCCHYSLSAAGSWPSLVSVSSGKTKLGREYKGPTHVAPGQPVPGADCSSEVCTKARRPLGSLYCAPLGLRARCCQPFLPTFLCAAAGVLLWHCISVGQVNYPKVADSSSFDEDSSDALSPEQPASHESQGSVPSPLESRVSDPLPSATSTSPTQVRLSPSTFFLTPARAAQSQASVLLYHEG